MNKLQPQYKMSKSAYNKIKALKNKIIEIEQEIERVKYE